MNNVQVITFAELLKNKEALALIGITATECRKYKNDYFTCDPDYIKVDGIKYTGKGLPFFTLQASHGNTTYVVTPKKYAGKVTLALNRFFADDFTRYFSLFPLGKGWGDYSTIGNAIAYRGGKGYSYGLYTYHGHFTN